MTKERLASGVDVFEEYVPHRAPQDRPQGEVDPEGVKIT